MAKARNSTIEVYRILAMVAIVAHHYSVHGGVVGQASSGGLHYFLLAYSSMGKWGVDVFVLIGAYFMAQSTFRWRGVRSVLVQVWTTSWMFVMVALLWLPGDVGSRNLLHAVAPVSTNFYWFVTVYVVLIALSPFINILVKAMTKSQHEVLMGVLFVLWSVVSLIPDISFGVNNITWFVELYLIAAYISRYPLRGGAKAWAASAAVLVVAIPFATILGGILDATHPSWGVDPGLMRAQNSPLVAMAAICGLVAVTKMKPRFWPAVNTVAGATFGVYLIHDNPFIRQVLWRDWVGTLDAAQNPAWVPLHAVAFTIGIYAVATALELVRQQVVQRPAMALGDRIFRRRPVPGTAEREL